MSEIRDVHTSYNLDDGPFAIGYTFCFGLMGILSVQCFIYFNQFPHDRRWTKALVSLVFLIETLITIFAFHGFWIGATQNGGDLSTIVAVGQNGQKLTPDPLWSFVAIAPLTGLVSSLTHGFFSWRIWAVSRSIIVPVMVMLISLLQFAMVTYGGIVVMVHLSLVFVLLKPSQYGLVPDLDVSHPMPFYIPIWLVGSLVCDFVITAYMIYFLLQNKSDFKNTRSLLTKLIKLTIETGLITTTAALTELVFAVAFRVTTYHIALFYIISKLYANCLLATLNSRILLNRSLDRQKSPALYEDWHANSHPSRNSSNVIQIHTKVETTVEMDAYSDKTSLEA